MLLLAKLFIATTDILTKTEARWVAGAEAARYMASTLRKQSGQEVRSCHKASRPTPSHPLPLARLHLLKVPQQVQTAP